MAVRQAGLNARLNASLRLGVKRSAFNADLLVVTKSLVIELPTG